MLHALYYPVRKHRAAKQLLRRTAARRANPRLCITYPGVVYIEAGLSYPNISYDFLHFFVVFYGKIHQKRNICLKQSILT